MAAKKTAKAKPGNEPTDQTVPSLQELQAQVTRLRLDLAHVRRERDQVEASLLAENERRFAETEAYAEALRAEVGRRVVAEARTEKAERERDDAFSGAAKLREAAARLEVQLANAREKARTEREAKASLQARLDGAEPARSLAVPRVGDEPLAAQAECLRQLAENNYEDEPDCRAALLAGAILLEQVADWPASVLAVVT